MASKKSHGLVWKSRKGLVRSLMGEILLCTPKKQVATELLEEVREAGTNRIYVHRHDEKCLRKFYYDMGMEEEFLAMIKVIIDGQQLIKNHHYHETPWTNLRYLVSEYALEEMQEAFKSGAHYTKVDALLLVLGSCFDIMMKDS